MRWMVLLLSGLLVTVPSVAIGDPAAPSGQELPDPEAATDSYVVGLTRQGDAGTTGPSLASTTNVSAFTYSLAPVCARGEGGDSDTYYGCAQQQSCGDAGLQSWVWEHRPNGQTAIVGTFCSESNSPAVADVLTPGRIREAFERIPVPTPPLEVQPPGGVTLVNLDTILHTEARPFTETVQLLNRQITFDIEPSEYTWTLGDGSTLNTTDPGRPWRQGVPMDEYLSHRYGRAGTVQLQLTTTWTARWRLPNGPWRPVDGTVETTTPPQQLEVTTARPQLISYD